MSLVRPWFTQHEYTQRILAGWNRNPSDWRVTLLDLDFDVLPNTVDVITTV